jgi:hypothetical protein
MTRRLWFVLPRSSSKARLRDRWLLALMLVSVLAALPAPTSADDWPGPVTANVFSPDGSHYVRLVPGSSLGDTEGFKGAEKGAYARGLFYAAQPGRSFRLIADVALVNPVAPVDALVTDRGELITFDNWHNFGFGAVVAMYDGKGQPLASFSLEDLYGEEGVKSVPRSISSRWWRCKPFHFVDPSAQTRVVVREWRGGAFVFSFPARSFEYIAGEADCASPAGPFSSTGLP